MFLASVILMDPAREYVGRSSLISMSCQKSGRGSADLYK